MPHTPHTPAITYSTTFNDYPVIYSEHGLYESALTSMTNLFEQALEQFEFTLVMHLGLYLPKDHPDTDLTIINDYIHQLKKKLNTDSLYYSWRKRADKSPHTITKSYSCLITTSTLALLSVGINVIN